MRPYPIILSIAAAATLGLAGCSAPSGPDPKVTSTATSGAANTTDGQANGMPFPKLEKGMTAETVRKLLGEPAEIQPTPSPEGKAEIWIYHFEKSLGMVQVAGGTRSVDVMPTVPSGTGMVTVQEPVYTMAEKKAGITLSILMFNGKLEAQKAKVEEEFDHQS